jgi:hypothetical protein
MRKRENGGLEQVRWKADGSGLTSQSSGVQRGCHPLAVGQASVGVGDDGVALLARSKRDLGRLCVSLPCLLSLPPCLSIPSGNFLWVTCILSM